GAAGADDAGDVVVWLPRLAHLDLPQHVAGEGQRRAGGVPAGKQLIDVGRRQLEPDVAPVGPGGRELALMVKAGNSAHPGLPKTTRAKFFLILHTRCNMPTRVRNAIPAPATARGRRTRTALLDAARAVIESKGFGALTMARVAEQAGVTRRAAYLHFPS